MGAVQRLALVVIIGLTALATLLVIYLADEPNRRAAEAQEQEEASLERAMGAYTQFCVSCHGPAGRGFLETGRIGWPLAGDYVGPKDPNFKEGEDERSPTERNQTENLVEWDRREATIAAAIYEGRGAMPAWGEDFGGELNDEQIRELVLLIHEGDWNEVYNHVIEANEGYPTVPPAGGGNTGRTNVAISEAEAEDIIQINAVGLEWEPDVVQIPVSGTIQLVNESDIFHTFVIEGYNDDNPIDMPVGETVLWEVPDDLPPREYTFYCSVPGHAEAGMVGSITILPALDTEPEDEDSAVEVQPEATTPGSGELENVTPELPSDQESPEQREEVGSAAEASADAPTLEAFDIGWEPTELTVAAGGAITMVNTGNAQHNFAIDGYHDGEVLQDIPVGGEPVTWQVPDDLAPGTYTFFCAVPGHREAGMEGALTVTE